jgi:hypothetical protein
VFGSRLAARGGQTATSTSCTCCGREIEQLADQLTELLGHEVGLVSLRTLHPLLQPSVSPKARPPMRCDILVLTEMIDAAEQAEPCIQPL